MIVDLAKLSQRLEPLPDDNEPVIVCIDPAKGYVKGNVAVICKLAERTLDLCSPEQRAAVMQIIQHQQRNRGGQHQ